MSKVVGTVLLLGIVLLLGATFAASVGQFADEIPEPNTYAGVEIDTDQRTAFIETTSVQARSDELDILVNGVKQRTWTDFSAGSRLPLFCLRPGDTVTVRDSSGDGNSATVAERVINRRSSCKFSISQPGEGTKTVTPINWQTGGDSVSEFYQYRSPHAHMDPSFVEKNTSYMFFYEVDRQVALVVVHDRPDRHNTGHSGLDGISGMVYGDTSGGAVRMEFHDLPAESQMEWIIKDDPYDDFTRNADNNYADPPNKVAWGWGEANTDGGALAGGFSGDLSGMNVTVESEWDSSATDRWNEYSSWANGVGPMEDWEFVTRNESGGLERKDLSKSKNVTIEIAN